MVFFFLFYGVCLLSHSLHVLFFSTLDAFQEGSIDSIKGGGFELDYFPLFVANVYWARPCEKTVKLTSGF